MARRFRQRSAPSLKTWEQSSPSISGQDLTAVGGSNSAGLKALGSPIDRDVTVLRTHAVVAISSVDTGIGAGDNLLVAFGIGICTTEAALVGAVPLPLDNGEWDGWFVHKVVAATLSNINGSTGTVMQAAMDVDSKAMRKVPSGQVLFLSSQLFSGNMATGIVFNEAISLRILFKTS